MKKIDQKALNEIRKTMPAAIAQEIINVQPMDEAGKALLALYDGLSKNPKTEAQLRAEGYRPVSHMGLMWIKDK